MSESLIFLSKSLIFLFFAKNKRFARKTDERIPSPDMNSFKMSYNNDKLVMFFPQKDRVHMDKPLRKFESNQTFINSVACMQKNY